MSTHAHELLSSIEGRWDEVPLLLGTADLSETSEQLHNALCRAVAVLIVAHFEGFLKDTATAVIRDLNKHSTFKNSPSRIKRAFCRSFTGGGNSPSKDDNEREQRLLTLFDDLNTKLDTATFTGGTSNPKPDVVHKICLSLGVDHFFGLLNDSRLDVAFSDEPSETNTLLDELRNHILDGVQIYPYKLDPAAFNLDKVSGTSRTGKGKEATLWEAFLDDLLEKRHLIAHGTTFLNGRSTSELRKLHVKTKLLMYALALSICNSVSP